MTRIIAAATHRDASDVAEQLRREYHTPGITVAEAFSERGLEPYVYSRGLEQFYSESDAFIFESAVWNRNRIKREMRKWIGRYLQRVRQQRGGQPLNVLCIGDGLGFDSAHFASLGHNVTYHEVPGPHEAVAREVFAAQDCNVRIVDDPADIPGASFDALVCLDVLEHVPDPGGFVGMLLAHLKDDGQFIVHAPFYMIHRAYPTHLKANRVHSGSVQLYTQHGLKMVAGRAFWNPLVFSRDRQSPAPSVLTRMAIAAGGSYLALGRWSVWPMIPVHLYRCVRQRWFQ